MILTCDRKIIEIDFRIVTTEVVIQPIITTIILIVFTAITPTLFLCVICYWIRFNECDNVFIKLFKTIPIDSIITIVITTCIGSFFSHSQQILSSYDNINVHLYSLHWACDCPLIRRKYWFHIANKSSYVSKHTCTKIKSSSIINFFFFLS